MPANELVLVDQAIKEQQDVRDAPLAEDRAFEYFACEQVLRDYELSQDELESGLIGASQDGALDGVYVFLGDTLMTEDAEILSDDATPAMYPRGQELTLQLVQAKRSPSFTETAIDLAASSLGRLLDLQQSEAALLELYSPEVVKAIKMFTTAWQRLATRRPTLRVKFAYATRGDTANINARVRTKASDLEAQISSLVTGSTASVSFIGAAELWQSTNRAPSYTLELPFIENATMGSSHVAIVRLQDYYAFMTDADGKLRRYIFDWNVRDYQGDIEVNREIRGALEIPGPEFWWMNNGVTIICSGARIVGKTFTLDDVQIVNGLQTSHVIYEVLSGKRVGELTSHDRGLLVKILVTEDPATRDQVIRATNRQTSVPVASLRATEDMQRKIEAYLRSKDWFYDRRKNYYRNIGKPSARIISIPFLAQAVMAAGLSEPDNSRARPSSLLKRDEDYKRVFSHEVPLQTYLWLAKVQRRVDNVLASESAGATPGDRTDLRFHVAMLLVARAFGGQVYNPRQLTALAENDHEFSDEEIIGAFEELREWASLLGREQKWALDRTAKSREFVNTVLRRAFPDQVK